VAGDAAVPGSLTVRAEEFLVWLRDHHYTEPTIEARRYALSEFIVWCVERGLVMPAEITRPVLERYQHWLAQRRKPDGQPLAFRTQYTRLVPIKMFFAWLTRQNHLLYNPASDLEMPRMDRRLPRAVLTAGEAEQVLAQPDTGHPLGLRDRAILETLYSTGIRRSELIRLAQGDLDRERGTVIIRQGKGRKDRIIPIGERALAWIEKYLREVRPALAVNPQENTLFLTHWGEPITDHNITSAMAKYVRAAQVGKTGSCHIFRHTMATVMLENGADVRFIQAMLGHADLSTTEIYTHVSIRKLKQVHTDTHPAAQLKPGSAGESLAAPTATLTDAEQQARHELLAALRATGAHVKKPDAPAT
jgi:integrase/recombinase XerD